MTNDKKCGSEEDGRPLTCRETMGIIGFVAFFCLVLTILVAYLYIK